jgi:hypothetical protein
MRLTGAEMTRLCQWWLVLMSLEYTFHHSLYRKVSDLADFPAGSVTHTSNSGYINEDLFLNWLDHFHACRSSGKLLLILDVHVSHCSMHCSA